MMIKWGNKEQPKYLSFVFGKEWEKGSFKFFGFRKVPLGWSINLWRFSLSFDDYSKAKYDEYEIFAKDIEDCDGCPLLDNDCVGGWTSGGGGEPIEPPCCSWNDDTLVYSGMYDRDLYGDFD